MENGGFFMDKTERAQEEQTALLALAEWENILEKLKKCKN